MKKKRVILLLLAILTVAIPTMWGHHIGIQRANRAIQEHPERFPDPARLRLDLSVHCATGGFLVGSFIVVYMVVSQALIKGLGVVINGVVSGVRFVAMKAIKRKKPNNTPDGIRQPADGSPKPSV